MKTINVKKAIGFVEKNGTSREHPLVKKCIERVIKLQADDGAWTSGDGDAHSVSTTISVLKVLKMFRIWQTDECLSTAS